MNFKPGWEPGCLRVGHIIRCDWSKNNQVPVLVLLYSFAGKSDKTELTLAWSLLV